MDSYSQTGLIWPLQTVSAAGSEVGHIDHLSGASEKRSDSYLLLSQQL